MILPSFIISIFSVSRLVLDFVPRSTPRKHDNLSKTHLDSRIIFPEMLIYIQPLRFETIETDVVNSFSAESIP